MSIDFICVVLPFFYRRGGHRLVTDELNSWKKGEMHFDESSLDEIGPPAGSVGCGLRTHRLKGISYLSLNGTAPSRISRRVFLISFNNFQEKEREAVLGEMSGCLLKLLGSIFTGLYLQCCKCAGEPCRAISLLLTGLFPAAHELVNLEGLFLPGRRNLPSPRLRNFSISRVTSSEFER